ncbi:LysR family transcriptional regulator [Shewanella sp. SHSM-M6]|uniref:LysR family transcriptional regulator n=2 Tax=Shewanella salipaludis TaxID=2723052 RepID=A0A972FXL2_9GAMM|nr:LysR family transcriptional regulator [Shewanella salipaludis]
MLVFDEVVKLGSFTKAAEALGHTKSAVSQYITQLEAELGVRLLNRSTRQLNLTFAGQQLAKRSAQLLELLGLTLEESRALNAVPRGRLAITAPHAFEAGLITPLVAELVAEYPQLAPELLFSDERLDLLEHKLDLAISVGPQKDSGYQAIPVGTLDNILVASPAFLARHGPVAAAALGSLPLIVTPWQQDCHLSSARGESLSFSSSRSLRVNTSLGAVNSALCGAGIALVSSVFVAAALAEGRLQRVLPDHAGPSRRVYALHGYRQQLPLVLRLLVERLTARLARVQGVSVG